MADERLVLAYSARRRAPAPQCPPFELAELPQERLSLPAQYPPLVQLNCLAPPNGAPLLGVLVSDPASSTLEDRVTLRTALFLTIARQAQRLDVGDGIVPSILHRHDVIPGRRPDLLPPPQTAGAALVAVEQRLPFGLRVMRSSCETHVSSTVLQTL